MSTAVSDTDVQLYLSLANPNATNFDQKAAARVVEEDDEDDIDLEGESGEEDEEDEYEEEGAGVESGAEEEEEGEDGDEDGEEEVLGEEEEGELDDVDDASPASASTAVGRPLPDPFASEAPMTAQELQIEKMSTLMELDRLKASGVTLTKTFTLDDELAVMQWEVRRHEPGVCCLSVACFLTPRRWLASSTAWRCSAWCTRRTASCGRTTAPSGAARRRDARRTTSRGGRTG